MEDNVDIETSKPRHEYDILSTRKDGVKEEWALSEYIHYTDGLIGKLDGSILLDDVDAFHGGGVPKKEDLPPPNAVIYLDKSARPVQWFVRKFWPILAQENAEMPESYFINLDRQQWREWMGFPPDQLEAAPDDETYADLFQRVDRVKDMITRIRALNSTVQLDEDHIEDAWNHPTRFDGKHIMIVDEVRSSGATLRIAELVMSRAFPEATISGQHWAKPPRVILNNGIRDKSGNVAYKVDWLPAWYDRDRTTGRGVDDFNPQWPEISESLGNPVSEKTKIGRYFLSTPYRNPDTDEFIQDPKSKQLRTEISNLADDLVHKRVLYRPDQGRIELETMIPWTHLKKGLSIIMESLQWKNGGQKKLF